MPNITNTDELIDTLTNLTTSVELPGGRFEPKMNAGANNITFDNIEQAFNQLYQKLRQLEDLHDFTELYIRNEFKKNKEVLDDAIQKLDAAGDDYTNTSTKANTASFQNSLVVTDRDGSSISTGTIIDGSTIMAASTDLTEAEPVQVNIQSSDIAYRRVRLPAEQYRAFYVSEQIRKDKIKESIDFLFYKPMTINFTRISAFNSTITRVALRHSNQNLEDIDWKHYGCKTISAIGIHIELESGAQEAITMNIQEDKDSFSNLEQQNIDSLVDTIFEHDMKKNGGAV